MPDEPKAISPSAFLPAGKRFQPGKSGNPGGLPKRVRLVRRLAQKYGEEALMRLRELMESEDDRVAYAACCAILDRGGNRPYHQRETSAADRAHDASDAIARLTALATRRLAAHREDASAEGRVDPEPKP